MWNSLLPRYFFLIFSVLLLLHVKARCPPAHFTAIVVLLSGLLCQLLPHCQAKLRVFLYLHLFELLVSEPKLLLWLFGGIAFQ